jgi:peptidoglycan/xylan/chitin deacetylase (PgdA/CDA1 family)
MNHGPRAPKTVYLTGDVHGPGGGGPDERWLAREFGMTELEAAAELADVAEAAGLPLTLFVSGEAARHQPDLLRGLSKRESVEIGGHTDNSHRPTLLHVLFERTVGSFYGPTIVQRRDIQRTLATLQSIIGRLVTSWRTHGFKGDERTFRILEETSVEVVSDEVGPFYARCQLGEDLWMVPVNTPPDYDHVYRGWFSPRRVQRNRKLRRHPFSRESITSGGLKRLFKEIVKRVIGFETPSKGFGTHWMDGDAYRNWLTKLTRSVVQETGFATLLLHPATMMLVDEMSTVAEILSDLQDLNFARMSEAPNLMCQRD